MAVVNAANTMGADKEPDEPIGFESVLPVAQAAAPRGISAGAARWRTAKNTLAIRHLARRDKTGRMQSRKTVGRDAELKEAKRKLKDLQQGLDGGHSHLRGRGVQMALLKKFNKQSKCIAPRSILYVLFCVRVVRRVLRVKMCGIGIALDCGNPGRHDVSTVQLQQQQRASDASQDS